MAGVGGMLATGMVLEGVICESGYRTFGIGGMANFRDSDDGVDNERSSSCS